jgi:hypothetical protein
VGSYHLLAAAKSEREGRSFTLNTRQLQTQLLFEARFKCNNEVNYEATQSESFYKFTDSKDKQMKGSKHTGNNVLLNDVQ